MLTRFLGYDGQRPDCPEGIDWHIDKSNSKLYGESIYSFWFYAGSGVTRRFYHGLSARETAEKVDVSYANVRFLQHRALKKLRDTLEDTGLFENF